MTGIINSIDTLGLVDGPGIRVVVFLKGCTLRCKFCHNPETWKLENGKVWTPEELVKYLLNFKEYFKEDGGVTFSGGEPLFQRDFLLECLKLCKQNNIHTALDTAGVGKDYEEILKYTDLVIYDIKALDEDLYHELTSGDIKNTHEFLDTCQKMHKKMWIRQVIIPDYNDNEEYILKLKEYISTLENIEKVELLPYHTMGVTKYHDLKIPYPLENVPDMDKEKCAELQKILDN